MSETAFIALGTNLGDRHANLREAAKRLRERDGIESVMCSPVWETAPWGVTDQPAFLNAAAKLETTLEPEALLDALLDIESEMGRVRDERWGPRLIDLDLILMGDRKIETARLSLPHPRFTKRLFVLVPMLALDPDLTHPITHERLADTATSLSEENWGTEIGPLEG